MLCVVIYDEKGYFQHPPVALGDASRTMYPERIRGGQGYAETMGRLETGSEASKSKSPLRR